MCKRIIPFALSLLFVATLSAQTLRKVAFEATPRSTSLSSARMDKCPDNDVGGPITFGNSVQGQSNSSLGFAEPIYLCFNDVFDINDIGNGAVFGGDPNPDTQPDGTQAGVAFTIYDAPPTNEGPDIATILMDSLIGNPSNPEDIEFSADGDEPYGGSTTFRNIIQPGLGQSFQDAFNNGEPIQWWFMPITFDAIENNDIKYEGTPISGQCVSGDLTQVFSVVYLNPIDTGNITFPYPPIGGDSSKARLQLFGGLPEFDANESYDIDVTNVSTGVKGTVNLANPKPGDTPIITVPEKGNYRITISDGKSCELSFIQEMGIDAQNSSTVEIESSGGTIDVGSEICVDFKVDGFDSLTNAQFVITWDTSLLTIRDEISNTIDPSWNIALSINDNTRHGRIVVGWVTSDFDAGTTYHPDSTLFTLCFTAEKEGNTSIVLTDNADFPLSDEFNDVNQPITTVVKTEGEINIIDPDKVTGIFSEIKNACPMVDNGSFEIITLGGTPPFEISISGPKIDGPATVMSNNETVLFEDLPAGIYQVLIRELTSGEFSNQTVEIETANLGVTLAIDSPISCNGFSDGEMRAEVAIDGTNIPASELSNYDFEWFDDQGDMISDRVTATNLSWGTYDLNVVSNNGCTQNARSSLSQPSPIMRTVSPIPASCSGVEDGMLALNNVEGGTGLYDFQWSNGVNQANNVGIKADDYSYTITDSRGCELVDTFILVAQNDFVVTLSNISGVSCFGFDDGSIDVTREIRMGTGATGTWDYQWSANATDIDNSITIASLASNLAPGSYSVTLTNSALPGCLAEEEFEIIEPDTLIIDQVMITNVTSCSLPIPDGEIEVTPSGGTSITGEYQFEWTDTAGMQLGIMPNLTGQDAGEIILTVMDDNDCIATLDTIIGTPPAPEVQFFENADLNCANDDADLQVIAVPGRPNFDIVTYIWEHDANLSGPDANNVGPGTYYVTIVDSDNCGTVDSAIVTAPEPITIDSLTPTEPCFETAEGVITLETINGGTPSGAGSYDFEWKALGETDVLNTTTVLTAVESGDYVVAISDANNCTFLDTITLNHIPKINVNFDLANVTGVDCFDTVDPADCNGFAEVTADYDGTGGGTFTFTWGETGEMSTPTNIFNSSSLCAGMQALRVTDGTCTIVDSVLIPSPDRLEFDVANASITPVDCFEDDNGEAVVAAIGGTGGYTFTWPDGGNEITKRGLAANVYQIIITDANDCIATHDVEITEPDELVANIDPDNTHGVICRGDNDGLITIIIEGGNQGSLNYLWTDNVSNINSAAGLTPGSYTVDITDAKGCPSSVTYTVAQPTPITANVEWDPIQCFGFQTGIRITSPSGGNGNDYSFAVDNSPARPSDETISDFGGDKLISLFDAEGCRVDTTIEIPQPRELEVSFADNLSAVEVDLGSSITLDLQINGDAPVSEIFWVQNGGAVDSSFQCSFIPCDNPTVNPLDNTNYTAFVTDANGCMSEANIMVEVDKNRNIYIPNVFAPNNAGFDTNDRFEVFTGSGVSKINYAKIFNRWGTMVADVAETRISGISDVVQLWDGFIQGEKANQGVYIYLVEVEFIDGATLLYRGDVALLR